MQKVLRFSPKGEEDEEKEQNTEMIEKEKCAKNLQSRESLVALFNGFEGLDHSKSSRSCIRNHSVDDILSSCGINEPVQHDETETKKKKPKNDFFELLQHEINHLKEKFELNERNYQLEDLMRLTVNSKNILKLESLSKNTEYDKKIEDSVYYELECHRMNLEQKIGFRNFSKIYGKMIHIINDELDSFLKNSFDKEIDLTKSYVIKKVQVAGDSDDLVRNIWKSIIDVLGDKQEYLPDIWELAMSENICYHF